MKNILFIITFFAILSCQNEQQGSTKEKVVPAPVAEKTALSNIPMTNRHLTLSEVLDSCKVELSQLKKKHDDIENVYWYSPKNFTHYNNSNKASIYLGLKEHSSWLRLIMSYEGDNWIFFEKAYLSYDGNTKEISFERYKDKESDNSGGSVWEWIDVPIKDDMIPFLNELSKSPKAKMRLAGKYTVDRTLSQAERKAIGDVIKAYEKTTYYQNLMIPKN